MSDEKKTINVQSSLSEEVVVEENKPQASKTELQKKYRRLSVVLTCVLIIAALMFIGIYQRCAILGHDWSAPYCLVKTCSVCGTIVKETMGHQWTIDGDGATSSCKVCGLSGWASVFTDGKLTIEEAARFKGRISLLETRLAAVRNDGTVYYWGDTGGLVNPLEIQSWSDIVRVSVGNSTVFGIKSDGTVCYSGFINGGDHDNVLYRDGYVTIFKDNSIEICGTLFEDISAIDYCHQIGYEFLVLCANGTVRYYSCFDGDVEHKSIEWMEQLTDVVGVAHGGYYGFICLCADGTLVGNPKRGFADTEMANWTDIVSISAYDGWVVGLKSDGTVIAYGDNDCSQCEVEDWTDIIGVYTGVCGVKCTVGLKADGTLVSTMSDFKHKIQSWQDVERIDSMSSNDGVVIVGITSSGKAYITGYATTGYGTKISWDGSSATSNSIVNAEKSILTSNGLSTTLSIVGKDGHIYDRYGTKNLNISDKVAFGQGGFYLLQDGQVIFENKSYANDIGAEQYGNIWLVPNLSDIVDIVGTSKYLYALRQDGKVVTILGDPVQWTGVANLLGYCQGDLFAITNGGMVSSTKTGAWSSWLNICAGDVVSAGGSLTIVCVRDDGTVVAAGSNDFGKCEVYDWKDIVSVSVSSVCTLGLKSDGTVIVAGLKGFGDADLW